MVYSDISVLFLHGDGPAPTNEQEKGTLPLRLIAPGYVRSGKINWRGSSNRAR